MKLSHIVEIITYDKGRFLVGVPPIKLWIAKQYRLKRAAEKEAQVKHDVWPCEIIAIKPNWSIKRR